MTTRTKLIVLFLLTGVLISIVLMLKPIAQDPAYHHFADTRTLFGIPNFANVVSNFLFLIFGIKGLALMRKSFATPGINMIYAVLFMGIFMTGWGSAYYHWHPDNDRLVYDRLPMTLVFMSLLAATIAEKINAKAGVYMLIPLLAIGLFSVVWWHYTESQGHGDLRLYGAVQFYPMILIPLILILFPGKTDKKADFQLIWVVIWYVAAKVCELFDQSIFYILNFISGHSIKHMAAAVATFYLTSTFKQKYCSKSF